MQKHKSPRKHCSPPKLSSNLEAKDRANITRTTYPLQPGVERPPQPSGKREALDCKTGVKPMAKRIGDGDEKIYLLGIIANAFNLLASRAFCYASK